MNQHAAPTRSDIAEHFAALARYSARSPVATARIYTDLLGEILSSERNKLNYKRDFIEALDRDELSPRDDATRIKINDLEERALGVLRALHYLNTPIPGLAMLPQDAVDGEVPNGHAPKPKRFSSPDSIKRDIGKAPLKDRLLVLAEVLGLIEQIGERSIVTMVFSKTHDAEIEGLLENIDKSRVKGAGSHQWKCKHNGLKFMLTDVDATEFQIRLRKESAL